MVNPYDTYAMGEALEQALLMPPAEQRERLRALYDEQLERGRLLEKSDRRRDEPEADERREREVRPRAVPARDAGDELRPDRVPPGERLRDLPGSRGAGLHPAILCRAAARLQ